MLFYFLTTTLTLGLDRDWIRWQQIQALTDITKSLAKTRRNTQRYLPPCCIQILYVITEKQLILTIFQWKYIYCTYYYYIISNCDKNVKYQRYKASKQYFKCRKKGQRNVTEIWIAPDLKYEMIDWLMQLMEETAILIWLKLWLQL